MMFKRAFHLLTAAAAVRGATLAEPRAAVERADARVALKRYRSFFERLLSL